MPWLPWWSTASAGGDAVTVAEQEGAAAAAERFLRRMIGDDRWEALPADEQEARRREGDALVAELRSISAGTPGGRPAYDLARIRCPVLTACGSRSKEHHTRSAHELAEPTVFEGAQHRAHSTHPEAFAAWVRVVVEAAATARGRRRGR
jgi:pimeloyl-ACP methyl ester carboxylesterase